LILKPLNVHGALDARLLKRLDLPFQLEIRRPARVGVRLQLKFNPRLAFGEPALGFRKMFPKGRLTHMGLNEGGRSSFR
jgi:hypothetical protein